LIFSISTNSKCQTQSDHLQHHLPNTYLTHFFAHHSIFSSFLWQKHQFGVFLKTIYQKGAVLKLFTGGICFYLYCAKGRGATQPGVDTWHEFVVPKTLRNELLHMQWRNHF